MSNAIPDRYISFKKNGQYYVFNSLKTGLKLIPFREDNPDYTLWEDGSILETLTPEQVLKLRGYELKIYANTSNDYKVQCDNYQITQTTDYTHFFLTGFGGIISMNVTATNTAHVLLSFDGRKTWHYYDFKNNVWEKSILDNIYIKSNTVIEINSLTQNIFSKIFKKNCTLDYAIALTTTETLDSVVLNLPMNTAPVINKCQIIANQTTHKADYSIHCEVDDFEGDAITYKIEKDKRGTDDPNYLIESGDVNPNSNGKLDFLINPYYWNIGSHTLFITFTDSKGASTTTTLSLFRVNNRITCTATINKGVLSFSITDIDNDNTRYQLILNGEIIQDYQDFENTPCNKTILLPLEKINFGEQNHLRINYQEDIFSNVNGDTSTYYFDLNFMGEYYGVLFTDITNSDPDANGKPNKYHYYSTSIGDIIKKLHIPPIIQGYKSKAYEIGCYNNSDADFKYVAIKSMYNVAGQYALLVSSKNPFDENEGIVEFFNLKVGETRNFYVKVVSYDNTLFTIDDPKAVISEATKK